MKTKLDTTDGPEFHVDLSDVSMIEMRGQRQSKAGWVSVRLTMKNNNVIEVQLSPESYDILVEQWIDKPIVATPEDPTKK